VEEASLQLILSASANLGGDGHLFDPDIDGIGRSDGSAW